MKKILLLLSLVCIYSYSQDSKVSALPEDSDISGDEYLYNIESGTSYKMDIETLLDVVQDSVDIVQNALVDSASDLRDYIDVVGGGSGYFLKRIGTYGGSESRTLVPKDGTSWLGLYLGSDPGSSYTEYTFYNTTGQSFFGDIVTMSGEKPIHFNTSMVGIAREGNRLIFWDNYADTVNLLELLEFPSSLTGHTAVNTGTYNLSFLDGSNNGYSYTYSTKIPKLYSATEIQLEAPSITLTGDVDLIGGMSFSESIEIIPVDTIDLGTSKIWEGSGGQMIFDTPFTHGGKPIITFTYLDAGATQTRASLVVPNLQLFPSDTYPHSTDSEPGQLQYDASEDLIYYYAGDALGGGVWTALDTSGGISGTYDSAQVANSVVKRIKIWDETMTYYDTTALEIDSSDAVYCATLSITSSNILNGDNVTLVSDPGTGKVVIPHSLVIYYEYGTTTYVSSDGSYSAHCENDSTSLSINVLDNVFESTGDMLRTLSSYGAGTIQEGAGWESVAFDSDYWIDFFTHTDGDGTATIKFYYTIADFN